MKSTILILIGMIISIIILATIISVALDVFLPISVDVKGVFFVNKNRRFYRFIGRPYPKSPIIEILLYLQRNDSYLDHVKVIVRNFINKKFKGNLEIKFTDMNGRELAYGSNVIVIRYREELSVNIKLNWINNPDIEEVYIGHFTAEFVSLKPWE